MKRAVDFNKPRDVRQWIEALRTEVESMADLMHEVTKPKGERLIERAYARTEMERAATTMAKLLRAGRHGLPRKTPKT
jgi:hypothetical protein